jgi:signal transduction histidine kinase
MAESARTPPRSLRRRLLWLTLGGIALTLALSGVALTALFRDHVVQQFQAALARQLDQLVVELEFVDGQVHVDANAMLDPRLMKPYSGLYWQIDVLGPQQQIAIGALRSRSLWDANLRDIGQGHRVSGTLEVSRASGPAGEQLLALQRVVRVPESPELSYRLIVAGDLRFNLEATRRFGLLLALALSGLLLLLGLAAWAQVSIGLRPLRELQQALLAVREGRTARLEGRFPQEVAPLVGDFNQVLGSNAEVVLRARSLAGNLAHALKTPLAVLENEAERVQRGADVVALPLLREQLRLIRSQIDWHLTRARIAASHGLPGRQTDVHSVITGLLRVLERAFESRGLVFHYVPDSIGIRFAGEEQDLQEMLGNLLENACKWANSNVWITVQAGETPPTLLISIEDDGPGIAPEQLEHVRQRGVRLDEQAPGSGLGLAIVQELLQLYGAHLDLAARGNAPGLAARLQLPRWMPA